MPLAFINEVESGATLGLWELSESLSELELALPRFIQSNAYKKLNHDLRKREWLGARILLKAMELPLELSYTEHGKPFYPAGPKISLTHSKDYIAIIIHPSREVGVDIQQIVDKIERIRNKFCNAHELEWAKNLKDYTTIWSTKEAVFKIKEKEVHFKEDIKVTANESELSILFRSDQKLVGHYIELEGYVGVYCVE